MSDECPYCGKEVEICHDDGYGMKEGEVFSDTCHECGKTFAYTTSISVDYDLQKADCLNGAEHQYKLTNTYPKRYTKMRCDGCGDERPLTTGELEELFNPSTRNVILNPGTLELGSFVRIVLEGSEHPIYGGLHKRNLTYDATEMYWCVNQMGIERDAVVISKDGGAGFYPNIVSVEEIF